MNDPQIGFECARCDAPPTQLTPPPAPAPTGFVIQCDACGLCGLCNCFDEATALESAADAGWKIWKYGPHWCPACHAAVQRKVELDKANAASICLDKQGLQCDCPECVKRFGPLDPALRGRPRHITVPFSTKVRQG